MIEKKSNYRFKYSDKFTPQKRIYYYLMEGIIDVHLGLSRSSAREKVFVHGVPLYTVNHLAAVRSDDAVEIDGFDDIRMLGDKGIILTPMGTGVSKYLLKREGLQIDDGAKNMNNNLQKLQSKRGRFVYYHSLGLLYEVNKPVNRGKFRVLPLSFREYQHWIVFSRKVDPKVIEAISKVIKSAKRSGEWDQVLDQ